MLEYLLCSYMLVLVEVKTNGAAGKNSREGKL